MLIDVASPHTEASAGNAMYACSVVSPSLYVSVLVTTFTVPDDGVVVAIQTTSLVARGSLVDPSSRDQVFSGKLDFRDERKRARGRTRGRGVGGVRLCTSITH